MSRKMIKSQGEIIPLEYYYTEISNNGVSKWKAIQYLAEKLDVSMEEIMAIGDSTNDMDMVQNAGLGIAMENGSPALKQIADEVTLSNDENGVANVLNKYFKQ